MKLLNLIPKFAKSEDMPVLQHGFRRMWIAVMSTSRLSRQLLGQWPPWYGFVGNIVALGTGDESFKNKNKSLAANYSRDCGSFPIFLFAYLMFKMLFYLFDTHPLWTGYKRSSDLTTSTRLNTSTAFLCEYDFEKLYSYSISHSIVLWSGISLVWSILALKRNVYK